jgi:hypothetical protein
MTIVRKALGALLCISLCAGCGSNTGSSEIRFLNASPDAPPLDFKDNNSTEATGVAYLGSTAYAATDSGTHSFQFVDSSTGNTLLAPQLTLDSDTHYTVVASNFVGSLQSVLYTDESSAPSAGLFEVRLINVAPTGGNVDLYVTGVGDDIGGIEPDAASIPFGGASGFLTKEIGSYEVRITAAGTKTVVGDSGPLTFTGSTVRTVVAADAPGGGAPIGLSVLNDIG